MDFDGNPFFLRLNRCLDELARSVGPSGHVIGVDLSENMLAEAAKLVASENLRERVELLCRDAADLPMADASVDGIFTSFTLELFDTPEIPRVLQEWKRVLKAGGRIVVVAITKEAPPGLILKAFEWTHRHFPNLMDCRPIYVRRALEAAGFLIDGFEIGKMWVPVEIVKALKPIDELESFPKTVP